MKKFVVANWKANLSLVQAERWLAEFSSGYRPVESVHVILAVPFLFILPLQEKFKSLSGISWAAQDVSSYPLGSYTGSVPAAWLRELVGYSLIGHRERRKYFHETIQDVANKASEACAEEIQPVLCMDADIARQQAAAIEPEDMEHLIAAYTPSDADQLEIARSVAAAADGVNRIASLFPGCPVFYGGGVNADNVAELIRLPGISGVMAAGGCLDPRAFLRLLDNAAESLAS